MLLWSYRSWHRKNRNNYEAIIEAEMSYRILNMNSGEYVGDEWESEKVAIAEMHDMAEELEEGEPYSVVFVP